MLFSDVELAAAGPADRVFVFEQLDARTLFDRTTQLDPDIFVESVLRRIGLDAIRDSDFAALVGTISKRLVDRFLDDAAFATELGSADDPRPAAATVVHELVASCDPSLRLNAAALNRALSPRLARS